MPISTILRTNIQKKEMPTTLQAFIEADEAVDNTLECCCNKADCVDEAERFARFLVSHIWVCEAAPPLMRSITHKAPPTCKPFKDMCSSHTREPVFTPGVWYNLLVNRMDCPCKFVDKDTVAFLNTGEKGGFDLAQFHYWLKNKSGLDVPDDMTLILFFFVNLTHKNLLEILKHPKFMKHTKIPEDRIYDLINKFSKMEFNDANSYTGTWLMVLKNMQFDRKTVLKDEPLPLEPRPKPKPVPPEALPEPVQPVPAPARPVRAPEAIPLEPRPAFEEAMREEEGMAIESKVVTAGKVVATDIACPIHYECKPVSDFRAAVKLRAFVGTQSAAKRLLVALLGGRNWRSIYVALFPVDSDAAVEKVARYRDSAPDMGPKEWDDVLKTATTDVAPTPMPEDARRTMSDFREQVTDSNLAKTQRAATVSENVAQIVTVYAPNWQDKWNGQWKLTNDLARSVNTWKATHPQIPTSIRTLLLILCRSADD